MKLRHFITGSLPVALLVALCWLPVSFSMRPALAQSAGSTLSLKDRQNVFNRVWRLLNERYYDPQLHGVNWRAARDRYQPRIEAVADDEAFYELLEQMVAELRDAHTHVRSPFNRSLRDRTQGISTGINVYEVEGQPVVTSITAEPEIIRQGVAPGMVLLAIDRQPVAARMAAVRKAIGVSSSERARRVLTYGKLLDGPPESSVTLTLASDSDVAAAPVLVTAHRRVVSTLPQVQARRLTSGFGYIHLSNWKPPAAELFRTALEQFSNAPGLIIDLRDNGGGDPKVVLSIGSLLLARRTSFGIFTRRSGRPVELSAGREGSGLYDGPLVILVNEASGSGSEIFAAALQESARAIIIGQQTCGCVLAADREKLPGGGELSYSVYGYLTARGRRLEGSGVLPDRPVPLKLSDLRERRDAALLEAGKVLQQRLSARQ